MSIEQANNTMNTSKTDSRQRPREGSLREKALDGKALDGHVRHDKPGRDEERERRKLEAEQDAELVLGGTLGLSLGLADGSMLGTSPNVESFAAKNFRAPQGQVLASDLRWIPVEQIDDNPFQPRSFMAPGPLKELVAGMNTQGQLQPCVARPKPGTPGRFELAAGHRRKQAVKMGANPGPPHHAKRAEFLGKVACIVQPLNNFQMRLVAIQENDNRVDIAVLDKAQMYVDLYTDMRAVDLRLEGRRAGWEDIEKLAGISYRRIRQLVELRELPEEMRAALAAGKLNEKHGRALLDLAALPEEQQALFKNIVREDWSGAQAERLAKKILVDRKQKEANFAPPSASPSAVSASRPTSVPEPTTSRDTSRDTTLRLDEEEPFQVPAPEVLEVLAAQEFALQVLAVDSTPWEARGGPAEVSTDCAASTASSSPSGPAEAAGDPLTSRDFEAPLRRASNHLINAEVALGEYEGGLCRNDLEKWLQVIKSQWDAVAAQLEQMSATLKAGGEA